MTSGDCRDRLFGIRENSPPRLRSKAVSLSPRHDSLLLELLQNSDFFDGSPSVKEFLKLKKANEVFGVTNSFPGFEDFKKYLQNSLNEFSEMQWRVISRIFDQNQAPSSKEVVKLRTNVWMVMHLSRCFAPNPNTNIQTILKEFRRNLMLAKLLPLLRRIRCKICLTKVQKWTLDDHSANCFKFNFLKNNLDKLNHRILPLCDQIKNSIFETQFVPESPPRVRALIGSKLSQSHDRNKYSPEGRISPRRSSKPMLQFQSVLLQGSDNNDMTSKNQNPIKPLALFLRSEISINNLIKEEFESSSSFANKNLVEFGFKSPLRLHASNSHRINESNENKPYKKDEINQLSCNRFSASKVNSYQSIGKEISKQSSENMNIRDGSYRNSFLDRKRNRKTKTFTMQEISSRQKERKSVSFDRNFQSKEESVLQDKNFKSKLDRKVIDISPLYIKNENFSFNNQEETLALKKIIDRANSSYLQGKYNEKMGYLQSSQIMVNTTDLMRDQIDAQLFGKEQKKSKLISAEQDIKISKNNYSNISPKKVESPHSKVKQYGSNQHNSSDSSKNVTSISTSKRKLGKNPLIPGFLTKLIEENPNKEAEVIKSYSYKKVEENPVEKSEDMLLGEYFDENSENEVEMMMSPEPRKEFSGLKKSRSEIKGFKIKLNPIDSQSEKNGSSSDSSKKKQPVNTFTRNQQQMISILKRNSNTEYVKPSHLSRDPRELTLFFLSRDMAKYKMQLLVNPYFENIFNDKTLVEKLQTTYLKELHHFPKLYKMVQELMQCVSRRSKIIHQSKKYYSCLKKLDAPAFEQRFLKDFKSRSFANLNEFEDPAPMKQISQPARCTVGPEVDSVHFLQMRSNHTSPGFTIEGLRRANSDSCIITNNLKERIFEMKTSSAKIEDFKIERKLGQGGYGVVYLVRQKATNDYFAMKSVKLPHSTNAKLLQELQNEISILRLIKGKFLAKAFFSFIQHDSLFIVMEYLVGGDFRKLLESEGYFEFPVTQFYSAELVMALEELHKQIIHRDLKPENLLLDVNGHLKLADFGLSELHSKYSIASLEASDCRGLRLSKKGTLDYIPPEVLFPQHEIVSSEQLLERIRHLEMKTRGLPKSHDILTAVPTSHFLTSPVGLLASGKSGAKSEIKRENQEKNLGDIGNEQQTNEYKDIHKGSYQQLHEENNDDIDVEKEANDDIDNQSRKAKSPGCSVHKLASLEDFSPPNERRVSKTIALRGVEESIIFELQGGQKTQFDLMFRESLRQQAELLELRRDPRVVKSQVELTLSGQAAEVHRVREFLSAQRRLEAIDWWAVGCLIYEFATGVSPFGGETLEEIEDNIRNHRITWLPVGHGPEQMTPETRDIIEKLLERNPKKRLGFNGVGEVKSHPFFKGVDWDTLKARKAPFVVSPSLRLSQMSPNKVSIGRVEARARVNPLDLQMNRIDLLDEKNIKVFNFWKSRHEKIMAKLQIKLSQC